MMNPGEIHQAGKSWSPWSMLPEEIRKHLRRLWSGLGFNPDSGSILRYELDMVLLRAACWFSPTHRKHVGRIRSHRGLKVHLGCGNALLTGWVNVDCYPPNPQPGAEILTIDMRRGLPFSDKSVSALFSEHFLEHLPFEIVRDRILPEIRRVLEPGAVVRLAIPNGEYFITQYQAAMGGRADPLFEANRHGKTAMTMLNDVVRGGGHHFLYDFETLAQILTDAGFANIRKLVAGDTEFEVFHGKDRQDDWRIAMSLYVEARVPA